VIRLKDKLIYTKINETVRLFCNSDGYPTPNVEWRKEGTRSVLKNFVKDNQHNVRKAIECHLLVTIKVSWNILTIYYQTNYSLFKRL